MQATIEIDLGQLANDWEVVRIGRPRKGEQVVSGHMVLTAERDWATDNAIIVRRKWQWPSWLKARWYCEDGEGIQRCCNSTKPEAGEMTWRSDNLLRIDPEFVDLPKIGGDWRQSLRENPNRKASPE